MRACPTNCLNRKNMIQVPNPVNCISSNKNQKCTIKSSSSSSSSTRTTTTTKYERLRRKSIGFIAGLFKLSNYNFPSASSCLTGMKIDEDTMQRSPRIENPGLGGGCSRPRSAPHECTSDEPGATSTAATATATTTTAAAVSRIPSTLSVTAVDVVVACRQAAAATSPSHSILTLTPGRTRNIDQDMEALRLSRQDNPYLQVLASKESLIEHVEESESDDAILMSHDMVDTDPLTLAQVHEHLVRSPPPASWNRSPIFHFPHHHHHHQHQQYNQPQRSPGSKSDSGAHYHRTTSPKSGILHRPTTQDDQPKSEGSMEIRDRHSHTFSLLNPTPIRSFSEVRRLHRSEDSVQLMSSE